MMNHRWVLSTGLSVVSQELSIVSNRIFKHANAGLYR